MRGVFDDELVHLDDVTGFGVNTLADDTELVLVDVHRRPAVLDVLGVGEVTHCRPI